MPFNWLHLTDLHRGMEKQDYLWQNVKESFFEDLDFLHREGGPWDLILFTGDLTDRGTKDQFDDIDLLLSELVQWIGERQSSRKPVLLAVPGNHDLQRPNSDDEGLSYLRGWAGSEQIQETFWNNPASSVRRTIDTAFGEYSAWWNRHVARLEGEPSGISNFSAGLLPGDFSATIENDAGCRLGILGLNAAFLQLTGADYQHKLALHTRQFHAACGGDGPAWANRHNACLLMTHHPPDWLDASSLQHLEGEITNRGRFALHLCGHLHEPRRVQTSVDGNKPKCLFQGRSLFGLETYGEDLQRLHGYAAGRMSLGPEGGEVRLWPRSGERSGPEIHLDRDPHQGLPKGSDATEPYRFDLSKPCMLAVDSGTDHEGDPKQQDKVFNRAIASVIDEALALPEALLLREALSKKLPSLGGSAGERLCTLEEEKATAALAGAISFSFRQAPRGDAGRGLRLIARRLLGWLLMRFIRQDWLSDERRNLPREAVEAAVEVGSEAGAEILWARWVGDDEPPEFRVLGARVVGKRNLWFHAQSPEEGYEDPTRNLDNFKAALWVVLLGDKAPRQFGPEEDNRLKKALDFHRDVFGGPRYYLTLRDDEIENPLARKDLLDALRRELGLPVLRVAEAQQDRYF